MSGVAFAGWANNTYYYNKKDEDNNVDATKAADKFNLMSGDATSGTIDSLVMKDGQTMTVSYNSGNKKNVEGITVSSLSAGTNSNITVNKEQTFTLTDFTGTLDTLTVNGTMTIGKDWSNQDEIVKGTVNHVIVNGNLTLGSAMLGLNNFTLGKKATLGGIYNLGKNFSGGVTFTLLDVADDIAACIAGGNNYERQLTSTMWNAETITSAILNVGDYDNGGLVFYNMDNQKYYSTTTWNNGTASFSDENIITLSNDTAYIVAKIQKNKNNNYHNITGLYGTVTIPEPTTATLSLLALTGLAARRRR